MEQNDVLLPDGRKTSELKVVDLKKELEKLNESRSGIKNELLSRLNQALNKTGSGDRLDKETDKMAEDERRSVTATSNSVKQKHENVDKKGHESVDLDDENDSHQISQMESHEDLVLDAPNDESLIALEYNAPDETFEMEVKHDDLANESINEELRLNKSTSNQIDEPSEKFTNDNEVSMDTIDTRKSPDKNRIIICPNNVNDDEKTESTSTKDELYEVYIDSQFEERRKMELTKITISNDSMSNENELKNQVDNINDVEGEQLKKDDFKKDKLEEGEVLPITARLGKRLPPTPTFERKSFEYKKPSFAAAMNNPIRNEEPIRINEPQKARQPKSCVLRIDNLVRPFTPGQLKEMLTLLTGEGTVKDIWLNRIKSVAYIRYSDDEIAGESREKLDGCKWPSINSKLLSADFSTLDEMEEMQTNDSLNVDDRSVSNITRTVVNKKENTSKESSRWDEKVRPDDKSGRNDKLRRDDRFGRDDKSRDVHHKRHDDEHNKPDKRPDVRHNIIESRRRKRSRTPNEKKRSYEDTHSRSKHKRKSNTEKVEPSEKKSAPKTKTLEDLFRKTVTQPCLYWLPASKEKQEEKKIQDQTKTILTITKS